MNLSIKKISLCILFGTASISVAIAQTNTTPEKNINQSDPQAAAFICPANMTCTPKNQTDKQSNHQSILSTYQPNYVLPFYYTANPQQNEVGPNGEQNKNEEVKFQISVKANIWRNILNSNFSWYLAYTQLSYWQAYTQSAYFRETNYEPATFVQYKFQNKPFLLDSISGGFMHQSNGRGGSLERSWNRIFADITFNYHDKAQLQLMPWVRVNTGYDYNPDISDYLGYGSTTISYNIGNNVISLMLRNEAESGFSRGAEELDYSFPIYHGIRGMLQAFSGYGQSLIEYNHYTNSIGVGFDFSDWLFT